MSKFPKPSTNEWWDWSPTSLPYPQVFDADPVKTGVIDADGRPIYRKPDPIGYVRFDGKKR